MLTGYSIFRFLFGGLFRPSRQDRQNANQQTQRRQNSSPKASKKQQKIIDSNEGEYIDYEEVKD
jgi:hypothetical protein